ncbi:hypothetical protein [Burkholderia diffusa]|uniref:hypothetical protein n=1 Tax=Burkholderia diffusa TaxID=488732 RepID=UPI002AB0DD6F|nr:hypothetical protein [Burkholderia diffusa]
MSDQKIKIPAFSDKIPNSTLGAWLALFVVFCTVCQAVIREVIYSTHHPNPIVLLHGKPVEAPSGGILFLILIPVIGGVLLFNLNRQKDWARKWTLGWIFVTLTLNVSSLFYDYQHYRFGLIHALLLIAAVLLLTPESRKWFAPERPM